MSARRQRGRLSLAKTRSLSVERTGTPISGANDSCHRGAPTNIIVLATFSVRKEQGLTPPFGSRDAAH